MTSCSVTARLHLVKHSETQTDTGHPEIASTMDLSDEFEHLSLHSFESDAPGTDYSFAGLSVASQVTDVLESSDSVSGERLGVEHFEVCFDAGVEVHAETEFKKVLFLGSGATMNVYKGVWKDRGQVVLFGPVLARSIHRPLSISICWKPACWSFRYCHMTT
jgi:hypothetical protein